MPRAKVFTQSWFHRQRQKAGGSGNPVVLNNNRSIMQRHRRIEDRHEQIVRKRRIDSDAAFDVGLQPDIPLNDDQSPGLIRSQRGYS